MYIIYYMNKFTNQLCVKKTPCIYYTTVQAYRFRITLDIGSR